MQFLRAYLADWEERLIEGLTTRAAQWVLVARPL